MGGTAALVTTVGSAVLGQNQRKKASKARGRQADVERRLSEIRNARARRQAVSDAIIQQSQVAAEASASGAGAGSSIFKAAQGSLQTQLQSALTFSLQQEALGAEAVSFAQQANKAESRASTYDAIGKLPGQFGLEPSFNIPGTNKEKP